MNDKDRYLEENTSQLIRAGFGAEVRPGPLASQRTFRLLAAQHRASHAPVAFPEGVLALLTGVLALMAVLLVAQIVRQGVPGATDPTFAVTALPLALNLICVPVAGIVIVARRR